MTIPFRPPAPADSQAHMGWLDTLHRYITGGQLQFPATQRASTDANTLDDYEEGTWTPSIGGDATYTIQTGTYTKIGRLVFVRFSIVVNVIGTGSASTITGLPFNVRASTNGYTGTISWSGALSTFVAVVPEALAGGGSITLLAATVASTGIATSSVLKDGATVIGNITYETD